MHPGKKSPNVFECNQEKFYGNFVQYIWISNREAAEEGKKSRRGKDKRKSKKKDILFLFQKLKILILFRGEEKK